MYNNKKNEKSPEKKWCRQGNKFQMPDIVFQNTQPTEKVQQMC